METNSIDPQSAGQIEAAPRVRRPRWINTPVFGRCKLVPHGMDEEPTGLLAYVERQHKGDTLTIAIYAKGRWHTRGMKPMGGTITAWYSMEREDGRPLF